MSAEPSRCTMQRHKQLTLQRCKTSRASNKRHPHFQKTQRFIDRLKHPFEGVSDFFYNLLRAVKISLYFLHFFTFFMDKTCFCSVLYITRAVHHTVLPLRKEHYYEIIRKTH